jgi:hypothetical protein
MRFGSGRTCRGINKMIRYLTAIVSVLLLSPQLVFAQPDNNYQRQGGYGAPYDSGRDNRQYDPNRGDYSQGGDQRNYQGGYANDQYAPGYARDCGRDQQNQQANNIAGVLLGALGGFPITHQLDCSDRNYAEPTYSRGATNETMTAGISPRRESIMAETIIDAGIGSQPLTGMAGACAAKAPPAAMRTETGISNNSS